MGVVCRELIQRLIQGNSIFLLVGSEKQIRKCLFADGHIPNNVSIEDIGDSLFSPAVLICFLSYRFRVMSKSAIWISFFPDLGIILPKKSICFVYDCFHISTTYAGASLKRYAFQFVFKILAWKRIKVLTISEFSRHEILRLTNIRHVSVLKLGWDHIVASPNNFGKNNLMERYDLPPRYLLLLGNIKPHKNIGPIVDDFLSRGSELCLNLVICGKFEGLRESDFTSMDKICKSSNIFSINDATDSEVNWLLRNCNGLISNSLYEGFGLPPLEALVHEKPVFCSDIPVYRELYDGLVTFLPVGREINVCDTIASSLAAGPKSDLRKLLTVFPTWDEVSNDFRAYLEVQSDR